MMKFLKWAGLTIVVLAVVVGNYLSNKVLGSS